MQGAVTTLTDPRGPRNARRVEATLPEQLDKGFAVGPWIIEGVIGRGGMSTVYAVHHKEFGKRAALKLANTDVFGPRFTADRFLLEARVVNTVDHPNVIDVFDAGVIHERPYLVMERLRGETLGDRLERGPMDLSDITDVLLALCDILQTAHANGVVHRDLKLDNVFLARDRGRSRIVLLDWGLATIAGEDPLADMIAGTPHYVAPEQVKGEAVTPRSDIYSLGVLAYVLYLGAAPFDGETSGEILDRQLKDLPPPPNARWAEIPPALERLILKMLEKRPEDRPSMPEVVASLRTLRRRPAVPPPPPPRPLLNLGLARTEIVDASMILPPPPPPEKRWWAAALVIGALIAGSLVWRMSSSNYAAAAAPAASGLGPRASGLGLPNPDPTVDEPDAFVCEPSP
jgi:eukaryotic-like serine/threonine-protein kinase